MLDPVIFTIFGISVYWYGFSYVVGFLFAYFFISRYSLMFKISREHAEDIFFYTMIISVIGARLFYVLFYNLGHYLHAPLEILAVWHGGMSIHGGILFGFLTIYWYCRKHHLSLYQCLDMIVIPVAFGLAMGRIANAINQELVGTVTTVAWGVIFPKVDSLVRHPSMLYESIADMLLFQVLLFLFFFKRDKIRTGILAVIFILGYSFARFCIDFFRVGEIYFGPLALGQIFCIIGIILGLILFIKIQNNPFGKSSSQNRK